MTDPVLYQSVAGNIKIFGRLFLVKGIKDMTTCEQNGDCLYIEEHKWCYWMGIVIPTKSLSGCP